jgi:IS30 family transposase
MDLIQGINGTFILTLVERKTRYLDMCRLPCGKKSDQMAQMAQMAQMVCARLSSYKGKVLTITTDNGSEFSKHEYIS